MSCKRWPLACHALGGAEGTLAAGSEVAVPLNAQACLQAACIVMAAGATAVEAAV